MPGPRRTQTPPERAPTWRAWLSGVTADMIGTKVLVGADAVVEAAPVHSNSSGGSDEVNAGLGLDTDDPAILSRAEGSSSTLSKLPAHEGVVHRGAQLPDEVLADHQEGAVIRRRHSRARSSTRRSRATRDPSSSR